MRVAIDFLDFQSVPKSAANIRVMMNRDAQNENKGRSSNGIFPLGNIMISGLTSRFNTDATTRREVSGEGSVNVAQKHHAALYAPA